MKLVTTPSIVIKLFPQVIWSFPKEKGKLFFTFDDGPNPETTPFILTLLNKYSAKATFFCVGQNVEKYKDLFELIISEGHSVGNHSFSHPQPLAVSHKKYTDDILKAASLIESPLFRPPYGRMRWNQYKTMRKNYQIVMWDISSNDYDKGTPPGKCLRNVKENAKDGSIILFHDAPHAFNNLSLVLPEVLEYFSRKNFSFAKIELSR
jgi:peptidoglycan-N-acetylglucosamine deacetylase